MNSIDTGSGFLPIAFVIVGIFWAILSFLMPFVIWGMASELKRQTLLLRGIIDELRALK